MSDSDFPALAAGQYAVVVCERATGIVLRLDGTRNLGTDSAYHVVGSWLDARALIAAQMAARDDVECHVFDHRQELVLVVGE